MRRAMCWVLWMSLVGWAWGQQASSNSGTVNPGTVPTVIRFSGNLAEADGKPLSGMVGVTFSLYKDEQGGAPLWVETQNVQADKSGHYGVTLGSTTTQGLPQGIFASGEARWVGVQPQGQAERPRVLLMSVPYALKAADAETVGGLPPSAFVLAAPSSRAPTLVTAGSPPVGGSGTTNYIPIWTDSTGDLGNSVLYQTGSGNAARVGLNTTTPVAALDIGSGDLSVSGGNLAISSGNLTMGNGNLNLPQTGGGNVGVIYMGGAPFIQACCSLSAGNTSVGNSALGFNLAATHNTAVGYQALAINIAADNTASGYQALGSNGQGKSNTAVGSGALLQNNGGNLNTAVGNRAGFTNTTAGSNNTLVGAGADVGVDGLTFAAAIGSNAIVNESNALVLGGTGANAVKVGIGTATPAATLDVQGTANFTGLITFAPGQTFGGTGSGTVTSVGSGAGLTGGPITTSGTLSIATAGVTNAMLANPGLTVSAGTDLTGGGPVALGGSTTLNLDTTKVPQLATANSFAATQTVNGNLALTGSGNGVQFPDGTLQTTAATGGGIPSGFMILGSTSTAPPGYTLSGTNITGNLSSPASSLHKARAALAAATVSGKLYAIGGAGTSGVLNSIEVYDPSVDTWAPKLSMPSARSGLAAAVDATTGKIYAIGGYNGTSVVTTVSVYDPPTNVWFNASGMHTARSGLAAAVDPTTRIIYAIGGYNGTSATNTLEVYDPSSDSWNTKAGMPTPRLALAAAFVNGKIYAIGGVGSNSRTPLATVEVYDPSTNLWSSAPPIHHARSGLAASVLYGKIYAIGGNVPVGTGFQVLNTVEVFDPSTNLWSTPPSPLVARSGLAVAPVNGFIYVIGGETSTRIPMKTVERYSPPVILYTFTKN